VLQNFQNYMNIFYRSAFLVLTGLSVITPAMVSAQNEPVSSGAVLKNIEDNISLPKPRQAPVAPEEKQPEDNTIYIAKLQGVSVDNELIKAAIEKYWQPMLGKSVTNQDVVRFKEWAWEKFRQEGYFAFLYTNAVQTGDSATLDIKVSLPKINSLKIFSQQGELAKKYNDILLKRLERYAKQGDSIDTMSLEQVLENISYDLPLELEMSIRPSGADGVELVVDLKEKSSNPGTFKNAVVQVNNYGLKQFGRGQALANISVEGLTAGSTANVLTQVSQGVVYGRFDYDSPSEFLGGHIRGWLEAVNSRNITGGTATTAGVTRIYGLGLTHILGSQRDMVFKSYVDASQRYTSSTLQESSLVVGNITDNQLRFKLSADNELLATRHLQRYQIAAIAGSDNVNGSYTKFELNAAYRTPVTESGLTLIAKLQAQFSPSRNLDVYNRISLGGVNGVRAYTTIDGVGDAGAVGTIELRQTLFTNHYIGVFYDGGVVKPNQVAIPGAYNDAYTLQDIGLSFGGVFKQLNYNISIAKGIGTYAGYSTNNIESSPNNWRINVALSYPF
jgi:hemolysin activation/secretion protein